METTNLYFNDFSGLRDGLRIKVLDVPKFVANAIIVDHVVDALHVFLNENMDAFREAVLFSAYEAYEAQRDEAEEEVDIAASAMMDFKIALDGDDRDLREANSKWDEVFTKDMDAPGLDFGQAP